MEQFECYFKIESSMSLTQQKMEYELVNGFSTNGPVNIEASSDAGGENEA